MKSSVIRNYVKLTNEQSDLLNQIDSKLAQLKMDKPKETFRTRTSVADELSILAHTSCNTELITANVEVE